MGGGGGYHQKCVPRSLERSILPKPNQSLRMEQLPETIVPFAGGAAIRPPARTQKCNTYAAMGVFLVHPPKQTWFTWKWGPLGKGDSYWKPIHFQVPFVNSWGCTLSFWWIFFLETWNTTWWGAFQRDIWRFFTSQKGFRATFKILFPPWVTFVVVKPKMVVEDWDLQNDSDIFRNLKVGKIALFSL